MTLEKHLRKDRVNDNLTLMQYTDGLTFGTDALLLAAYVKGGAKSRALELGGGTGIVSLLLATRKKVRHVECVEIQPAFAALAQRNVTLNALDGSVKVTEADIRRLGDYGEGEFVPMYLSLLQHGAKGMFHRLWRKWHGCVTTHFSQPMRWNIFCLRRIKDEDRTCGRLC